MSCDYQINQIVLQLRSIAQQMTYNVEVQAVWKHQLHEIAGSLGRRFCPDGVGLVAEPATPSARQLHAQIAEARAAFYGWPQHMKDAARVDTATMPPGGVLHLAHDALLEAADAIAAKEEGNG